VVLGNVVRQECTTCEIYSPPVLDCGGKILASRLSIHRIEAYAVGTGTRRLKADNIWSYAV
jgi:hypothetical protein